MDPNLLRLTRVFSATTHQIYWRSVTNDMVFAGALISNHTHKHMHDTVTNSLRHTYKYILTLTIMYTQQLLVLHWMENLLIQKFTLQRSTMPSFYKNYSFAEVIYLLIWFNKTKPFVWNTQNTDRNKVNEQNTHTTHRQKG